VPLGGGTRLGSFANGQKKERSRTKFETACGGGNSFGDIILQEGKRSVDVTSTVGAHLYCHYDAKPPTKPPLLHPFEIITLLKHNRNVFQWFCFSNFTFEFPVSPLLPSTHINNGHHMTQLD
jgi:hypothetical protein